MLRNAIPKALLPRDFTFLPNYFSRAEQRVLLVTSLRKLDGKEHVDRWSVCIERLDVESIQSRRRRKALLRTGPPILPSNESTNPLQDHFLPDDYYEFEEVPLVH